MRKHDAIDLMKLYSLGSANGWNKILTECLINRDINRLTIIRYQIQAGMDDLTKLKLNTPEVVFWYCRLLSSLEKLARKILKIKHPMPGDTNSFSKDLDALEAKRKRDQEFNKFLAESAY